MPRLSCTIDLFPFLSLANLLTSRSLERVESSILVLSFRKNTSHKNRCNVIRRAVEINTAGSYSYLWLHVVWDRECYEYGNVSNNGLRTDDRITLPDTTPLYYVYCVRFDVNLTCTGCSRARFFFPKRTERGTYGWKHSFVNLLRSTLLGFH